MSQFLRLRQQMWPTSTAAMRLFKEMKQPLYNSHIHGMVIGGIVGGIAAGSTAGYLTG